MAHGLYDSPSRLTRETFLTRFKNRYASVERAPCTILSGTFRGITMSLSMRTQLALYLGLYEREIFRWARRLSRDIATAIDVGVAEGQYALFFLRRTSAATVWAFEPDLNVLPLLQENLRLNGLSQTARLELKHVFVGDSDGDREIRLDTIADSVQSPCLIKVDCEGAETMVLHGAQRLNDLPDIRWLIETHSKALEDDCLRILTQSGLQTRIIANAWWRTILPDYRPLEQNRWLAAWRRMN